MVRRPVVCPTTGQTLPPGGKSLSAEGFLPEPSRARKIIIRSKVDISFLTHERSNDSVFRYSTVVTNRVDNPAGNPDKPEGGGYFGIEESGRQEDDEEDWDSLQGVLVDSLVAVEDLLGVGIHGGILNFV